MVPTLASHVLFWGNLNQCYTGRIRHIKNNYFRVQGDDTWYHKKTIISKKSV